MSDTLDHSKTFAVVGELVMIANAIDHLLNRLLIEVLSLAPSPLLEPVIATLEPARKIEILKSHAKHIRNSDWKKPVIKFCEKAESVNRQRKIVCHTPAFFRGGAWKFQPVAAVKLFNKLDVEKKAVEAFPFNDIKAAITTGEAALGAGFNLLDNLARFHVKFRKRYPRSNEPIADLTGKP